MVSVVYLVNILFTLVAISSAERLTNGEAEKLEPRWFGGLGLGLGGSFFSGYGLGLYNPWLLSWAGGLNGCFGYGIFNGFYNNVLFAKATDDASLSLSRRAISLDADQLHRRGSEKAVSCINETGQSAQFLRSDCVKAANQLSEKKVSAASYGGCALSLVSPKDRVAPKEIPAQQLEKAVDGILKACSTRHTVKQSRRGTKSIDSQTKDVALLLSKPHA